MPTLDEASLFAADPRVLADPFAVYEAAREVGPIVREPHEGVFLVTRYEDIVEISNRHDEFSALVAPYGPWASGMAPARPEGCPFGTGDLSDELDAWQDETTFSFIPVIASDPPRHTAIRALVNRLFTPARLKELAPGLAHLAADLVDEFAGSGEVEFVSAFASVYPFLVINELFGIPPEDRATMRTLYVSRSTPAAPSDPAASLAAMRNVVRGDQGQPPAAGLSDLNRQLLAYMKDRRAKPRGDVFSDIATARFPDGTLPELEELLDVSAVVYGAGHNTTSHFLGNAMLILATHPELQQQLRDEPSLIANFVDEALRFAPPVHGLFRYARRDAVVDGVEIPAGSILWLLYAAANRDPERFDDPQQFECTRVNARVAITFGHGIHFCPGHALARLEGRLAITELLARMDHIRLADEHQELHWPFWFILRGPDRLPLHFDPR